MKATNPAGPVIRELEPAELDKIQPLWEELYRHQVKHGMQVAVPPEGFALWARGLRPLLGRFARVYAAWEMDKPCGFLCARLRNQPPHFSGEPTGFISEVFVSEAMRSRGLGRGLMQAALDWFDGQNLTRVELQVIAGNPEARKLYAALGWKDELIQMVRLRPPPLA